MYVCVCVTEFAELGSLYEYLRGKKIDFKQILQWAKEIALGTLMCVNCVCVCVCVCVRPPPPPAPPLLSIYYLCGGYMCVGVYRYELPPLRGSHYSSP